MVAALPNAAPNAAANAAIAAINPIPPPVVANVALNQMLDDVYGNPVTSLEHAHASAKRLKLSKVHCAEGQGHISQDEYQRTVAHSTGAHVKAAVDNQFLDLPALQNQTLLQTIRDAVAPLLAPLQESITEIKESITEIKVDMREMHNNISMIHNAKAAHPTFHLKTVKRNPPLLQVPVDAAQPAAAPVLVPPNFPATYGHYLRFSNDQRRQMLIFYGLQPGTNNENDATLRTHLGLPLPEN